MNMKYTEVLNIQVMLGNKGLNLVISARHANRAAFDHIMGDGWIDRFGDEIGNILERSKPLNVLLLKRGEEIALGAMNRMREEGRL